jgi:hypothetical protein
LADVETLIACAKITKSVIAGGLENDFVNGCGSLCFGVASPLSPGSVTSPIAFLVRVCLCGWCISW